MKKKKKLYHTLVTQFCRWGGDPINYWKYAKNWKENQRLVANDFNEKYEFVKGNYVEMELIKVYENNKKMKKGGGKG
ncbi:MAG: hypothetical protein KAS91_00145 [Candidatus Pacebacteria bacterium]|nr:hypothetical protein [Candidatus Paceibacterota bacterium]